MDKSKAQISNLVKTAVKIMGAPAPLAPKELYEQVMRRNLSDHTCTVSRESAAELRAEVQAPLRKSNWYKHALSLFQ